MESVRYPLPPREHHLTTKLRWCRMARLWRNYSCGSRTDLHVQSVTMTSHLILSMPRRRKACTASPGRHNPY
ncbi:hypothetical protein TNCV_3275691 [Trichonephila clavipes]|nr:hypothetical protein TNCV_3275691 [Trichonephila clavipes]